MLSVLINRTYRHLLAAQVVALTGTGLATVALGLLAFDLAGDAAGMVLGTALTIKMAAHHRAAGRRLCRTSGSAKDVGSAGSVARPGGIACLS